MKFFEGWVEIFNNKKIDRDLQNWARIEYKNDAEFAYDHMLKYGIAPSLGAKH